MSRACLVARLLRAALPLGGALVLVLAVGCTYEFTPPAPPDLYKVPNRYDLGDRVESDLSAVVPKDKDMSGKNPDLAKPPVDLAQPTDGG